MHVAYACAGQQSSLLTWGLSVVTHLMHVVDCAGAPAHVCAEMPALASLLDPAVHGLDLIGRPPER